MIRWLLGLLSLAVIATAGPVCAAAPFDPFASTALAPGPGARLDLSLRVQDQGGRTRSLAEIGAGLPLLFVPVQHRCPNICGVTLAGVWDALGRTELRPGRDVGLIAFGLDAREGPSDAATNLSTLQERVQSPVQPVITAVTAPQPVIAVVTGALGYRFAFDPQIGQYAHPAAFAVLAPDGRLVRWFSTLDPEPRDLSAAIRAAARSQPPSAFERVAVLLCYRYDPATGRFTPSILAGFRIFGVGSALVAMVALTLLHLRSGPGRVS